MFLTAKASNSKYEISFMGSKRNRRQGGFQVMNEDILNESKPKLMTKFIARLNNLSTQYDNDYDMTSSGKKDVIWIGICNKLDNFLTSQVDLLQIINRRLLIFSSY